MTSYCIPASLSSSISSLALQVSNLECSEGVFTLDDCSRPDSVVFSGGCLSQDAGWVECRETGVCVCVCVCVSVCVCECVSVCVCV